MGESDSPGGELKQGGESDPVGGTAPDVGSTEDWRGEVDHAGGWVNEGDVGHVGRGDRQAWKNRQWGMGDGEEAWGRP